MTRHLHTCMLCEACCGLVVEVEAGRVVSVRGDKEDPLSRGHICPKATGIEDIRTDPDRVTKPLRRTPKGFVEVSWDEALDEAAERLRATQKQYGRDSVALYVGNPTVHSYTAMLGAAVFTQALGTRSRFSATSVDQLPQMLAALEMFGHQGALPVPDVDRTRYMLILGANPVVSNGSLMTAPGIAHRLEAVQKRGGKLVVIDPRKSETAAIADEHHFITPGTDAFLLLAILHTLFAEEKVRLGHLQVEGLDQLRRACAPFSPERVAKSTGIGAETIARLARELFAAEAGVVYGRVGACTQEFGGMVAWLINATNAVTGNLDRAGGVMLPTPAVDARKLMVLLGQRGHFGRYKSRVRGLPEFSDELPSVALAEEIDTPGAGQIRSLVTFAGNPVLSTPNGARLERALPKLDFMVSIDIYKNETTRHAHLILPTSFGMERDHYDLVFYMLSVRNAARFVPGIFPPAGDTRDDWEILLELSERLAARRGLRGRVTRHAAQLLRRLGPTRLLETALRTGPHRLSLKKLRQHPSGVDLGPLQPSLGKQKIRLAPELFLGDLRRLEAGLDVPPSQELRLISRRLLRSNNSWMHNVKRLVKGPEACTLLMHPRDASARGLESGAQVKITSRTGEIRAPLEVTDEVTPGIVCLPHGFGHGREGTALRVAEQHAGASINDLTDELRVDALTGTASLSVPVAVERG